MVIVGGATRLTESGLSIVEWKPVTGVIPPLTAGEWARTFEDYKQIPQYKELFPDMDIAGFKFIYFWEWFHREWARLIGVVFFIPFVWFVVKKKIEKWMINPMIILFLLGILQALLGWIMVASGLNPDDLYVDHIRLAIHFMAALGLLCYTLWFAFMLLVPEDQRVIAPSLKKQTNLLFVLLVVQLVFGAFMAGLKAANFATTWPLINGEFIPSSLSNDTWSTFTHDPLAVHFIHRNLAYLLAVLIFLWYRKSITIKGGTYFNVWRRIPLYLVLLQVVLGILTVLYANNSTALLWLGVAHQFTGMMLLLSFVIVAYLLKKK